MCELAVVFLFVVAVISILLNWRLSERIALLQEKMGAAEKLLDNTDGC